MPKKARKNVRQNQVSSFHQRMTIGFLVVSSLLVLLIFYFTVAEVHIKIVPESSDLMTEFSVELLPDVETTLAGTNIIPATITTGTETRTQTIRLEGGTPVPAVATGMVTIINNYSRSQPLIATTRLLTPDGKLFRISEGVTVPAGGSVEVEAYADEAGAEFEIGPSTFTIPGLWEGLQDDIYAESSADFTGGTVLEKTVNENVIDSKSQEFVDQLTQDIERTTYPEEGYVQIARVTGDATWEANVEPGATVENFQITVNIPVTTVMFAQSDLDSVAVNTLVSQTPPYQQFLSADLSQLTYDIVNVENDGSGATIEAQVRGKSASRLQRDNLDISELKGKQYEELIEHVENIPGVADVQISFTPSWLKKVPSLQDHVFIEIIDSN
ncbi:MAG: hypothetical protein ACPGO5_02055 [Patescibacteria group bacterium]